jgi:nuclear pore complex protein Nup93
LNDRLHAEFNQRLRHAREKTDPYKFALYKIIGRCELRRKTVQEVVHTVEDYIWMQVGVQDVLVLLDMLTLALVNAAFG